MPTCLQPTAHRWEKQVLVFPMEKNSIVTFGMLLAGGRHQSLGSLAREILYLMWETELLRAHSLSGLNPQT